MSIRTRLALGVALVLAVAFGALGISTVRSMRATLTDQVDDRVCEVSAILVHKIEGGPYRSGGYGGPAGGDGYDGPFGGSAPSSVGEFVFSEDGDVVDEEDSGYPDNPDPRPDFPAFPSAEADALVGDLVTLPAVDGSMDYRVLVERDAARNYVAVAAPLDEVDQAVARVVRTVAIGGAGTLVVAGLASWVVIRRGFRPVDRMVDTAAAIAGGDLSRRVPKSNPRTELGRLGEALNEMLGQIEQGVAARAANEERLRRFVADAAHELRTPLTSVRGYAELYRQGALTDDAALAKAMGRIEAEGGRMARLVDDLLLLARLDRQVSLEIGRVALGDLARDAVDDFQITEPDHPVDLRVDGAVAVSGDKIRLRQVIDNLLTNVGVHTPPDTAVHVQVRQVGPFAEVTVADEGPGISEVDRPHVFERFWRGDPSRVRKTGGTGLGLAIVSSLTRAHGGSVSLESEAGKGASFTVKLPLNGPEQRAAGASDGAVTVKAAEARVPGGAVGTVKPAPLSPGLKPRAE